MSIEQNITGVAGWHIGEDKVLRFYVTQGVDVEVAQDAADGALSISVKRLKAAFATNAKLRFMREGEEGGVVATLSAAAALGDEILTVAALASPLKAASIGRQVRDISSDTIAYIVSDRPAGAKLINKSGGAITKPDATNGVVDVAIADDDTVDETTDALKVESGTYYHNLLKTDEGDEQVLVYGMATLLPATR